MESDSSGEPLPQGNGSISAFNETLPNLEPEAMKMSAMRFTYVAVSNLFTRVKK